MQVKKIITRFLILSIISALFVLNNSCTKEDPESIAIRDREKIIEYLKKEGLFDVATEHESGLFYVMINPGTGLTPTLTSPIKIQYEGYYLDQSLFDSSPGATIVLQSTILGWRVGIPLFKNGGQGKLLIPSAMGYGPYPPWGSGIRRNAVLIFDFTIVDIAK